jgi:hypothetical protein
VPTEGAMKKITILLFVLFFAASAQASVTNIPIQSGIELKPGETKLVTLDSIQKLEVGWSAVQEQKCTMHCVEATDKSGGYEYKIATDRGASTLYTPVGGKISIEYKNVAEHPVTIDVYKVKRVCDAESCVFLKDEDKGRWLVFKVDEFRSIETSKDNSYSVISGVTAAGKEFTVKAVWWTDNNNSPFTCYKTIGNYLKNQTPKEDYAPYILSGSAVTEGEIILKNVDTCVPKAPHFGVPDENVYPPLK